jgi:YebC/PmpR family DNA-binding regulatory protein
MSGHSKWANIKRQKQAADLKRGAAFSKLSRLITTAVVESGGIIDPEYNVKLRLVIEKAKQANMPKENIKRAIERGLGPEKDQIKEVIYEAFAPQGVALLILATTDNPNRTRGQIREILDKNGGKLANPGAISYLFIRCGLIIFDKQKIEEEKIFEIAQKLDALDIEEDEKYFNLYIPFENIGRVNQILEGIAFETIEIDFKPKSLIKIEDKQIAEKILNLVDLLEKQDEVQKVFANFDIPDEFLKNS